MKKLIIFGFLIVFALSQKDKKEENLDQFLKATKNCEAGDEKFKKLVLNLTNGVNDTYNKTNKIFKYVRDKVKYKVYSGTKLGALATLTKLQGNAVDQTHLLIALLRTAGIPARYKTGVVSLRFSTLGHVWTEAYFKGKGDSQDKWHDLDPTSSKNTLEKIANWKKLKKGKTSAQYTL